jgi:hypothetical protein
MNKNKIMRSDLQESVTIHVYPVALTNRILLFMHPSSCPSPARGEGTTDLMHEKGRG